MAEDTTIDVRGSCVCGEVRWRAQGRPKVFQYCFCSRCRKVSGGAFVPNLFLPADGVSFLSGEHRIRRFDLPETRYWSTAFCEVCGSSVPWLSRNGRSWIMAAGALDDDPGIRASLGVFYGSKAAWYDHEAALALHDTVPPRTG